MNINVLLAFCVIFLLVFGFLITIIKNEELVWKISVGVLAIQLIVALYAFINFDSHIESARLNLFSGFGVSFLANEVGVLLVVIASFLWLISCVETKEYFAHHSHNLKRYYSSLIITFSGALGVFLAEDLLTLFVFFEIMSFASYLWVAHNLDEKSYKAQKSYLSYAVFGGLCLLFGIFILFSINPNLAINTLSEAFSNHSENALLYVACVFMFIGFGAKAGSFFVHDWLALAHTASPAPASGLLSGLLTKAGVYGIIIVILKLLWFSQTAAYIVLGISLLNMLGGAFYAFMAKDLKRVLAYSSVSQIGFILWGVALTSLLGSHNTFAAYGTIFHMVNHSLIKILLFSLSGVIYQNAHTLDLNELKGFGKDKLWLKTAFGIGAASLMGIPLLSGYVSKTLLHEAMVELIHFSSGNTLIFTIFEWLFLLAGGFTFAYMLKLFICLFVEKPEKEYSIKNYVTIKTKALLSIVSIILIILGVLPNMVFGFIGEFVSHFMNTHAVSEAIAYFSLINLKGSFISIGIGLVLYFVIARKTVAKNGVYNDFGICNITIEDYIYKPVIGFLNLSFSVILRVIDISLDAVLVLLNKLFFKSVRIPKTFFEGKKESITAHKSKVHITYTLSYSLLMFGIGFLVTLIYLLIIIR